MATQPTQASWTIPSAQQKELTDYTLEGVRKFRDQGGFTPYAGETVAGFDPTQVSAQERALGTLTAQDKLAKGAADATNYWTQGNIWSPEVNTMLGKAQTAAVRPITEDFLTSVLPSIRSGDIMGGTYGNPRYQNTVGQATERTARAVGDTSAKLVNDLYRTNVEAQQRAVGQVPQVQEAQLAPAKTESAVGDARQALSQARLNANQNYDYLRQFAPLMSAQEIAALLPSMPGGTTMTTANNPEEPSQWKKALAGGLSGAAAGSTFGPWGAALGGLGGAALSFA